MFSGFDLRNLGGQTVQPSWLMHDKGGILRGGLFRHFDKSGSTERWTIESDYAQESPFFQPPELFRDVDWLGLCFKNVVKPPCGFGLAIQSHQLSVAFSNRCMTVVLTEQGSIENDIRHLQFRKMALPGSRRNLMTAKQLEIDGVGNIQTPRQLIK